MVRAVTSLFFSHYAAPKANVCSLTHGSMPFAHLLFIYICAFWKVHRFPPHFHFCFPLTFHCFDILFVVAVKPSQHFLSRVRLSRICIATNVMVGERHLPPYIMRRYFLVWTLRRALISLCVCVFVYISVHYMHRSAHVVKIEQANSDALFQIQI